MLNREDSFDNISTLPVLLARTMKKKEIWSRRHLSFGLNIGTSSWHGLKSIFRSSRMVDIHNSEADSSTVKLCHPGGLRQLDEVMPRAPYHFIQ
jgi:hypothetical protein